MTDDASPELVALLAEQQGLQQALANYPDAVRAAAARGLKPLGAPPQGYDPLTPPAPVFDPARFGADR
jgi:hypothetical protein